MGASIYVYSHPCMHLPLSTEIYLSEISLVYVTSSHCFLLFFRDLGKAGISGPLLPDLGALESLQYMYA
jgi:hypothetical protein